MSTVEEAPPTPSPSDPLSSDPLRSDMADACTDEPREPLSDERLGEIAATLGDLPALPDIALRAMRLAEDPEWEVTALDDTIRRDQALAARFLRLANSAFFGARSKISTLDRAITLVGITRVRSVRPYRHRVCRRDLVGLSSSHRGSNPFSSRPDHGRSGPSVVRDRQSCEQSVREGRARSARGARP